MNRTIDLWLFLPPYLKNFHEMCALLAGENPEFQMLADECTKLIDELFIQTASEVGLSKFEKVLGISHVPGEALDERRSAIMTRWNDVSPYTMTTLKNRIIAIQGNDQIEVYMLPGRPYEIAIVTHLEKAGQVENLDYVLQSMIPCNLIVHSANMIQGKSTVRMFYSIGAGITGNFLLTNDLNEIVKSEISQGVAFGQNITNTLFLTNDLVEIVKGAIPQGVAFSQNITDTLFLTNDLIESSTVAMTEYIGTVNVITNIIEIN
ncbi:MAG: DUF2313 domain-containing protein [Clostridiales bacterium]|nr:DUF2313 domain-containing protein [Clostridiales bacterium]